MLGIIKTFDTNMCIDIIALRNFGDIFIKNIPKIISWLKTNKDMLNTQYIINWEVGPISGLFTIVSNDKIPIN